MTRDEAITALYHAYQYCVSNSRFPRDDWDNASLILIVLVEAMRGNPMAIKLVKKYGR